MNTRGESTHSHYYIIPNITFILWDGMDFYEAAIFQ